jgi:hypothetical protein
VNEHPDDVLGAAVSRLYTTIDPPPPQLVLSACAALSWRNPDAALAALLVDSAVEGEAAGIRGTSTPRMLSFGSGDTVVDVEVVVADGEVRLVGQVSRAVAAPLSIRHRGGTWSGSTDAVGRFAVADLPRGPLRVCWGPDPAGTAAICTPAIFT